MLKRLLPCYLLFTLIVISCGSHTDLRPASPLPLASFSENDVTVNITLEQDSCRRTFLAATFTPESGYHLYSKDIPRDGIYGEGRPTLLELTPQSQMRSIGELTASVGAEVSAEGPDALLVYPAGPVTLELEVVLPHRKGWFDDQVVVTYMACSGNTCKPPAIGKIIPVRVPGMEEVQP